MEAELLLRWACSRTTDGLGYEQQGLILSNTAESLRGFFFFFF